MPELTILAQSAPSPIQIHGLEELAYPLVLSGDLEITPDGSIWRLRRLHGDHWNGVSISYPCTRKSAERTYHGYRITRVTVAGRRLFVQSHRLVYRHFKGIIPDGLTVNHEDGQKDNNNPDNLTLATGSEQTLHAIRVLGSHPAATQRGKARKPCPLSVEQVLDIRLRHAKGEINRSIAERYDISIWKVSAVANGRRRKDVYSINFPPFDSDEVAG